MLTFDPDLLILTFCVNDIELMPDPKPRPETILLPKPIHSFLGRYKLYGFVHTRLNQLFSWIGVQPSYAEYLQQLYRTDTQEWQQFTRYLNTILSVTKERQKPLLLVIFPSLERFDETHPYLDLYANVAEIGKVHGVEVLDLFPYFKGKNPASLRVSLMNGHPNAEAYDIAAEAMYQTIVENNLFTEIQQNEEAE